jgi:hypothetical protein
MTFHWPRGLVPTIAKQATNQAVRFPVQFYAKQFLTGGDKSLETNPIYNGNLDYGHGYTMTLYFFKGWFQVKGITKLTKH